MIDVKNMSFTYHKNRKKAINNISFKVNKGEIFGFLGPSGAGKTTTQKIIIGLLRDYEGSINIMDKERSKWNRDFFEKVGVAFDFPNLYLKLTARENLNLISGYYKNNIKDIDEMLDKVGLLKDADKRIEGYSKGMKMRINFIRALIHNPDIVFLDEPTAGLDPVNAKTIKDMILELKKDNKTIFLTTHNMSTADQLCDKVAFIVEGKIPVIDSPKNLKLKHSKELIKVEYADYNQIKSKSFSTYNIGNNEEFINTLKEKNIKTIHSQESSLEEIFIKITGKKLI